MSPPACVRHSSHLEPVVNAREAQGLAEDVRARPLTAERRLPALLELLSIRIGESAGTGLERAVGVKPALHHIELAQSADRASRRVGLEARRPRRSRNALHS